MTDKDIQQLIDRFLEGTTNAEEERLLARELLRDDIPDDWKAIRLMLGELAMGEAAYDDIMASRRHRSSGLSWRWMAEAACLAIIIGLGTTLLFSVRQPQPDKMVAHWEQPTIQPTVDTIVVPAAATEERGLAEVKQKQQKQKATRRPSQIKKAEIPDTLGSSIFKSERNVMLAIQMLSECETIIEKGEQMVRNAVVEATYHALPQPKTVLVISETGDYQIMEENQRTIIEI